MHPTKRRDVWGKEFEVLRVRDSLGIGGVRGNSVKFPTGFSVGMGWVWELKSSFHGCHDFLPRLLLAAGNRPN